MDVPLQEERGTSAASGEVFKWPGWPGESVFRLIVPVMKVGSIIGRKGEFIKKLCEETRARVRVLDGASGTDDRIVLISAREEQDAEMSPAMDAVLRIFKRVNAPSESSGDGSELTSAFASVRLLVASSQGINLIGKQGTMIKSLQGNTGATIRVLSGDELPHYATADERVVEIHGEYLKVLNALEVVAGHLRKFLVDRSVLPLFEKISKLPAVQAHEQEFANSSFHPPNGNGFELQYQSNNHSLYGQDSALSGFRSSGSGLGRNATPLVTQVTQTMQIPLSYAEDIIGLGGGNIAYIRRTSGAVLTVQETKGVPDEITVEIKGNPSQVQQAQQIVQEFLAGHKDPLPSGHGIDPGLRSSYMPSSFSGYGSSGYGSYRI